MRRGHAIEVGGGSCGGERAVLIHCHVLAYVNDCVSHLDSRLGCTGEIFHGDFCNLWGEALM